jgi:hypothetical protein
VSRAWEVAGGVWGGLPGEPQLLGFRAVLYWAGLTKCKLFRPFRRQNTVMDFLRPLAFCASSTSGFVERVFHPTQTLMDSAWGCRLEALVFNPFVASVLGVLKPVSFPFLV